MAERITVKQASDITGLSQLTIRVGMQLGTLPLGSVIKASKYRSIYHIVPNKLAEYLGISVDTIKQFIEDENK